MELVIETIRKIATAQGKTMAEVVRDGSATEVLLAEMRAQDARIEVKQEGDDRILVFR